MPRLTPTLVAAVALLAALPGHAADLLPNDTFYSYQWYAPKMNMPTAWGLSQGSSSVIAAVLDTGVWAATPDLGGRVLPALCGDPTGFYAPRNGMEAYPLDHGTQVAGVLAMGVNNAQGGAGVGNFSILPITIAGGDAKAIDSWAINGVRMAADHGARVINISYGLMDYAGLDSAAAYARSKGALTFVAIGNASSHVDLGPLPNLLFVSGTDANDQRWTNTYGGSNWGSNVAISAPAANIVVTGNNTDPAYGLNSGTSFATPLVAGAAALAWSINPALTPDQVEAMLLSTATKLGTAQDPLYARGDYGAWNETYGYGRLDLGAVALAAESTITPEPATVLLLGLGAAGLLRRRRAA